MTAFASASQTAFAITPINFKVNLLKSEITKYLSFFCCAMSASSGFFAPFIPTANIRTPLLAKAFAAALVALRFVLLEHF